MTYVVTHKRSQALVNAAIRFAKGHHEGQLRKYTGEPYIEHPISVAKIVSSVTEDVEVICAAILHDVLEDTNAKYEDLINRGFGWSIANMVLELTDVSKPSDGNRSIRKAIDRMHLAKASKRSKTVKLADMIDNSCSIVVHDPNFAVVYMREMKLLLPHIKDGDISLFKIANQIVEEYYASKT